MADSNENSTTDRHRITRSRMMNIRLMQNFLLVWLDANIDLDHNVDSVNTVTRLREVVNTVHIFTNPDECVDFITNCKDEKIFMIVSGSIGQGIVPNVHHMSQLSAIFILCAIRQRHENWAKNWSKIRDVFTGVTPLCEALKKATHICDHNTVSISFVKSSPGTSDQKLDQLDPSFMYTQILKEILLTINFEQKHIHEFLTYCREQFEGNTIELKNIDKIEQEYHEHTPSWWYTYPCFLYSMLNRALRMMEVDLIIKMGFFIGDLHNHIVRLHNEQSQRHQLSPFVTYRGQEFSRTDFEQLTKTKGGLISFNNFLSTSLDRQVSLRFAESTMQDADMVGTVFQIIVDPSVSSSPFASIKEGSYYQNEEEIIFSMHSVFRIGEIRQLNVNNRLWEVDLTLTSDNDPQLRALAEELRHETFSYEQGWLRLANLLIKLGQFEKAEQVCKTILDQATDNDEKARIYYMLGVIKDSRGEYGVAIDFHKKALSIKQGTLPANHPSLASSYNNIGSVYYHMGKYSETLKNYEKALVIYQETLPENHPDLARYYNNVGAVYKNLGEYLKALEYYEKAREIRQQSLPPNHPDLASSYNNIGGVYKHMGEYSKALDWLEKALLIQVQSLPSDHPNLASSYSNIGLLYHHLNDYSKALSSLQKAIDIHKKTLSTNHPNLAISYNNVALVYDDMENYDEALSCHEKALEIREKTLPYPHSDLAVSYNNIGLIYDRIDECSKALEYYGKALAIYNQTLPSNHSHLGACYNNIGEVYFKMRLYETALSNYEQALQIQEHSLPCNHPDLQITKENIEKVKQKLSQPSQN